MKLCKVPNGYLTEDPTINLLWIWSLVLLLVLYRVNAFMPPDLACRLTHRPSP